MASTFYLEIVTPEKMFYSGDVEMVVLKTVDGEMGILKEHAPTIIAVAVGPIRIKKDGEWLDAVLSEGFMEINPDKSILLIDTAEWPHEVDFNRASAAKLRAEERLMRQTNQEEYIRSKAALARALARLKVTKQ